MKTHFILYVSDQERSTAFYQDVLGLTPALHVPGMTEFRLPGGATLGLMPETGIVRLLGSVLPNPERAHGIPRSEFYLVVENAEPFLTRALEIGARLLSPLSPRDWGHEAGYVMDPDSHVLAFAQTSTVDDSLGSTTGKGTGSAA